MHRCVTVRTWFQVALEGPSAGLVGKHAVYPSSSEGWTQSATVKLACAEQKQSRTRTGPTKFSAGSDNHRSGMDRACMRSAGVCGTLFVQSVQSASVRPWTCSCWIISGLEPMIILPRAVDLSCGDVHPGASIGGEARLGAVS
jgi:hypothetical protein